MYFNPFGDNTIISEQKRIFATGFRCWVINLSHPCHTILHSQFRHLPDPAEAPETLAGALSVSSSSAIGSTDFLGRAPSAALKMEASPSPDPGWSGMKMARPDNSALSRGWKELGNVMGWEKDGKERGKIKRARERTEG